MVHSATKVRGEDERGGGRGGVGGKEYRKEINMLHLATLYSNHEIESVVLEWELE